MTAIGAIRQGDVLLYPVPDVKQPAGVTPQHEIILAYGEATGHAHRLTAGEVYAWEVDGQRYVRVAGDALGTLSHEDHDPVPAAVVTPGVTYRVIPQRETGWDGEWQRVLD